MSALPEFGSLDNATLAALTFELASQLHIERMRRLALEAVLSKRGILTSSEIDTAGEDAVFREEASRAADLAVRKLLRVLAESADERVPLRGETPGTEHGET